LCPNTITWCEATDGRDPSAGDSSVKLFVVVGFEREPATENFFGIPEFDTLKRLQSKFSYAR
jgi:hypothetical protein